MTTEITCEHFRLCGNGWEEIATGGTYGSTEGTARPRKISDTESVGDKYLNQSKKAFTGKLCALAIGTPTISLFANALEGCAKACKLLTFSHFWKHKEESTTPPIKKQPYILMDFSPLSHKREWQKPKIVTVLQEKIDEIPNFHCMTCADDEAYDFTARLKEAGNDCAFLGKLIPSLTGRTLCALVGGVAGCCSLNAARTAAKVYASLERWQDAGFMLAPCFQPDATQHGLGGDIENPDAL